MQEISCMENPKYILDNFLRNCRNFFYNKDTLKGGILKILVNEKI